MPFLIPALTAIMQAIPTLAAKWGGTASVVAERNTAIAQTVVQSVLSATGSVNEQQLVEKLKSDPVAVQQATQAVQDIWWQIDACGIGAARKADVDFVAAGGKFWQSPSFVVLCLMLPLVYFVMGAVVGLYGNLKLDPGVRASIITGLITGIVIAGGAYYWGSTTSKNKPQGASQ